MVGVSFVEFEMIEDLKEFIQNTPKVKFENKDLKKKINEFEYGTTVEVKKQIGSSVTIISVEEVTEEFISKGF